LQARNMEFYANLGH